MVCGSFAQFLLCHLEHPLREVYACDTHLRIHLVELERDITCACGYVECRNGSEAISHAQGIERAVAPPVESEGHCRVHEIVGVGLRESNIRSTCFPFPVSES